MTPQLWADAITAFLVQYLGLGAVFFAGVWIAWRQGDVGLRTRRQRLWLGVLLGGFLLYAGIHGMLQLVLPLI